jgi:p-hydroxybenzoate 3-monooxygenase
MMRTQVAIIGAGPAGLLLSHILHLRGISSVILEARSQSYCEARIRAGILEQGTVDILRAAGMGARMDHEGLPHHGIDIAFDGGIHPISIEKYDGGRQVMAYGQTEIVKDMFRQHEDNGTVILTDAKVTGIRDIDGVSPQVHYHHNGKDHVLACDFVAGCDGFRGVSRNAMPASIRNDFDLIYPYSWLGILAKAPPMNKVVIYAQHPRGFALQSMRSNEISRLYIQVDNDDHVDNWSDEALWDELDTRIGVKQNRGDIVQKGIRASVYGWRCWPYCPTHRGKGAQSGHCRRSPVIGSFYRFLL